MPVTDETTIDDIPSSPPMGRTDLSEPEPVAAPVAATSDTSEKVNLIKTLEAMQERMKANDGAVAKVVSDPMVRELLRLKESGKKVRIVEEDDTPAPRKQIEEPVATKPLDEMTNAELVAHFSRQSDAKLEAKLADLLGAIKSDVEKTYKPVVDRVKALDTEAQARTSQSITTQINAVREKYADFDKVQPIMVELNRSVQGLTVEELYHMAKLRSGLPPITQKQIETERPDSPPRERQAIKTTPSQLKGKRGFSELLDEALERNQGG